MGKSTSELGDLAAQLGSDIPFFLHGPSSICRGRGEIVQPKTAPKIARWVVLILPGISMPTPAVYRQFDRMNLGHDCDPDRDENWNQWAALSSRDLLPLLVNDLEAPSFAINPLLSDLRLVIEKSLERPVRMSGSGSSLFTLYDDPLAATQAADFISRKYSVRANGIEMA